MKHSLLAVLVVPSLLLAAAVDLKTDYRENPLGVDHWPLHLSWRMKDEGRAGAAQSAYQIQSAATREALLEGRVAWDSGRVKTDAAWQVPYGGPVSKPGERVWWRVKIWDEKGGEGEWSAPTWFEAGVAGDPAWKEAPWIGCDRDYKAPEPAPADWMGPWIQAPTAAAIVSYFKDVELPDKPVVSAVAYWGLSKLSGQSSVVVNYGKRKGYKRSPLERVMRPKTGGFADMAFYLEPGTTNRIEMRFEKFARGVAATIGMKIVFADGTEMWVKSGEDWRVEPAAKGAEPAPVKVAAPYGGGEFGTAKAFDQTNLPPAWFRGAIKTRGGMERARLYLCALGQGPAFVNGTPVSDELLAPPQSDYETSAYYTAHDITALLKPGDNALAVLLDAGWYHQVGGFGAVFSYGRPGLKALVVIDYAGGKRETFTAGPEWQWKEGAIREANIYRGEKTDFRRDHGEWKTPRAGTGWKAAQVIPPCSPTTTAMDVLPVRRGEAVTPVKRWQIGPKTWLYDMGQVMFGWVRFTMEAPSGTTVRLRYTEYAREGVLENVPTSQWWCHGRTQGDEIVSDGKKRVFEPVFTTKSFRYVEVSGLAAPPEDLAGIPVVSTARPLATFESSDPLLDRLFANGMRTWRNYVAHTIADVPRERCLWGAESIYTGVPGSYCYDYPTNHRLMLDLWCTGEMTEMGIPGNIGVGKRLNTRTSSFAWSVTPVFIASDLFEHYGDLEASRPHYDLLRRTLRHAEENGEEGGTIPVPHEIGDHAPAKDIKRKTPDSRIVNTLVFFDAEQRFARLADALGKADDAAHARAHAGKVRATILGFYDREKHTFGVGTLDSLALAYGVIEEPAERTKLADSLAGIYRANGHQFDGGFLSYEIYPELSRSGHVDDALKMLVNTDVPGPARSVKEYDATTFWETYYLDHDYQMFRGLNFIAYTHSIGWMLTDLAGIRYRAPAQRPVEVALAPHFPASLERAAATVETPAGIVRSAWKREGKSIHWTVVVPPNTTTGVQLPGWAGISVNGKVEKKNEFKLSAGTWEVILGKQEKPE